MKTKRLNDYTDDAANPLLPTPPPPHRPEYQENPF